VPRAAPEKFQKKSVSDLVTPDDTIKWRMKSGMLLTLTSIASELTNVPDGSPAHMGSV
jgi:hypothetical protein